MGRGLFSIRSERDGIVRRVPLVMKAQGEIMPSLSLEMLRLVAGGRKHPASGRTQPASQRRGARLRTADRPATASFGFILRNAIQRGSCPRSMCWRVVSAPAQVGRKLVLIGTSAAGLLDLKTTPVDPSMPGVEVHAQVLESMLTKSMLSSPNYAIGAELVAAVVIGVADHLARADPQPVPAAAVRRGDERAADRHVLVSLHAAEAADRSHLSADVEPR